MTPRWAWVEETSGVPPDHPTHLVQLRGRRLLRGHHVDIGEGLENLLVLCTGVVGRQGSAILGLHFALALRLGGDKVPQMSPGRRPLVSGQLPSGPPTNPAQPGLHPAQPSPARTLERQLRVGILVVFVDAIDDAVSHLHAPPKQRLLLLGQALLRGREEGWVEGGWGGVPDS